MKNLSIYIHIPVCESKCLYCDFCSYSNLSNAQIDKYVTEIKKNILLSKNKAKDYIVRTIYFGGGTPSCIDPKYIQSILSVIRQSFVFDENPEISIECNPNNITLVLMDRYKDYGVNRISIGIQNFSNRALKKLGRTHDVKTARKAINIACEHFDNVSIDLIHSIPGCKLRLPRKVLTKIQHLSCYALTSDKFEQVSDEKSIKEQTRIERRLSKFGLAKYEVSNFSKKDMQCRHNMVYWTGGEWIGFGESAESWFNKPWSGSDLIMLGLRLTEGVSLQLFDKTQLKQINSFIKQGLLLLIDERVSCTSRGFLLLNRILSSLI